MIRPVWNVLTQAAKCMHCTAAGRGWIVTFYWCNPSDSVGSGQSIAAISAFIPNKGVSQKLC